MGILGGRKEQGSQSDIKDPTPQVELSGFELHLQKLQKDNLRGTKIEIIKNPTKLANGQDGVEVSLKYVQLDGSAEFIEPYGQYSDGQELDDSLYLTVYDRIIQIKRSSGSKGGLWASAVGISDFEQKSIQAESRGALPLSPITPSPKIVPHG